MKRKLTSEQKKEIIEARKNGESAIDIAKRFGISRMHVYTLSNGHKENTKIEVSFNGAMIRCSPEELGLVLSLLK